MNIKFDMKVEQNHASFYDEETGDFVAVDSFNNRRFNVRVGTVSKTRCVGSFNAVTDGQLNRALWLLTRPFLLRTAEVANDG